MGHSFCQENLTQPNMRNATSLSMLILILLIGTSTFAINTSRKGSISKRSLTAADCSSSTCLDCLTDCSGCSSCRLCTTLAEACERKGVLMLRGKNLCHQCKYCGTGGEEECMERCMEGKETDTCQTCESECN